MKSSRGFTLIELLVVIAIIGILMALLFPAVNGALDAARKTQAKNDVTQIATAIIAFQTEYGRLPASNESGVAISSALVNVLTGAQGGIADNPRKIPFIEVQGWKKGKSGTNTSGNWLDPWGNPYFFAVDGNYDNTLNGTVGSSSISASDLRKQVAVWNDVTNANLSTAQKKRRSVASWE